MHWKYKNLTIVIIGIIIAIYLSKQDIFIQFLHTVGNYGYIGAFLAGMFFVSTFTVATSSFVLFELAQTLSPIEIGLIAGMGAVLGDLLIFNLVKNDLTKEINMLYKEFDHNGHFKKLFHSKYFNWMLPLFGAMIIASPLPDEMGVSLMGISKMNTVKFILISYILNSVGLFLIISASIAL